MGQVQTSELQKIYDNLTLNSPDSDIFYEDEKGHNLLFMAVANNIIGDVKFLLERGLNINHQNKCGNTPLHFAVGTKNLKMVKFLIEKGADYNCKNNSEKSPYDIAKQKRYLKIIACILRARRLAERSNNIVQVGSEHGSLHEQLSEESKYESMSENKEISFLCEFKSKNEDCSICSEKMTSGKTLSCGHSFHGGCIGEWIIQKRECPLCRRKIRLE